MLSYIARRLLLIVPTIFIVTIIVFLTIRLIPGSIVDLMASERASQQWVGGKVVDWDEIRSEIKHDLGLDVPMFSQYGNWLKNVFLHGDFGRSLWKKTPVLEDLVTSFPVTLELGFLAGLIAFSIAIPIGVYSAVRQDTIGDYIARSFSILLITLPTFWVATLVIILPALWWDWTPEFEYISFLKNPAGNLLQFIIPAVILGAFLSGATMRMTRTMMLDVLRQDYIRTAWSKGLKEKVVVLRHALRNALIPVITLIGIQAPLLLGGSVVLEKIFALPGIGALTINVINTRDYTILSGINLFIAMVVVVINLVIDVLYAYIDPRIHYT